MTSFAIMLRHHRLDRRLTQEELAHASGLSVRAVRNAELGAVRYPRRDSVQRLADALELPIEDYRAFVDLARGDRGGPAPVSIRVEGLDSVGTADLEPGRPVILTWARAGDRITGARQNVRDEPEITLTFTAGPGRRR